MAKYESKDLRNLALCGQLGAGKTILAEAMLLKSGLIQRLGSIADGTTASDYDPEEKARQYSVNATPLHCSYAKKEFNIIDTPGGIDFFGGQISGITGADIAVICVNATKGVEVVTRKAWDLASELGRARILVITHMDADNIVYADVLDSIQKTFGKKCLPFTLPQGEGSSFTGVADVFGGDAPADLAGRVEALRTEITESAVEANDAMMEKYLEEGEISAAEFAACLKPAIAGGMVVPVYCLAAAKDLGVEEFMKGLADNAPAPVDMTIKALTGDGEEAEETTFTPSADAPLLAQVFKTISDPHVGKLCFARIYNGTLQAKSSAIISATGKAEKIGHLYRYNGEKQEEISAGTVGDIVTVAKIDALNTGDLIFAPDNKLRLPPIAYPKPMVGLAIVPKTHGDEGKIGTVLHRLAEEDPTFTFANDQLTKELVIRGMGMIQLDVVLSRMKNRFNVEVNTKPPKIPYLETISAKADGHYRHKKQSGGAGQFAEVYIHLSPNERGAGFEFINSVVGGAISQSFVGSTEKGILKAMEKGPLAGYPVVDIIVDVYDGKEHPVDSKDIAFQTAGRNVLYQAMEKAKPTLLEPIVNMEIVFPSEYTGDINGDISGRRGRPTGMESFGDMQMIKAQVPLAEVSDYGATLKAITRGEGFFSMELSHYEAVPSNIAQAVIAKLKAEEEEKDKK